MSYSDSHLGSRLSLYFRLNFKFGNRSLNLGSTAWGTWTLNQVCQAKLQTPPAFGDNSIGPALTQCFYLLADSAKRQFPKGARGSQGQAGRRNVNWFKYKAHLSPPTYQVTVVHLCSSLFQKPNLRNLFLIETTGWRVCRSQEEGQRERRWSP